MRGDRNVQKYVEARRDLDRIKRQAEVDPSRLKNAVWKQYHHDAIVAHDAAMRNLSGGQLGRARRILAQPPIEQEPDRTEGDQ